MPYGTPTGYARTPGLRHQYEFNGLKLNKRNVALWIPGASSVVGGTDDRYKLTGVAGFEDGDIRDAREVNAGVDGEQALTALYGGRTIVLDGVIEAGSYKRLEDMKQALRQAFDPLVESDLICHDVTNDFLDEFETAPTSSGWTQAGTGTFNQAGSQLSPSATGAKTLVYTAGPTVPDCEVIIEFQTGTSVGTTTQGIGAILKYIDANNYIYAWLSDNGNLQLSKVDGGVTSTLPGAGGATGAGGTLATSTTYWLVARTLGNLFEVQVWDKAPLKGVSDLGYKSRGNGAKYSYTLVSAADIAKFGTGVKGKTGIWWSPNATSARINWFFYENYDGDIIVRCRKMSVLQGQDQQTDWTYRRPFQVTLRASSKDLLDRSITAIARRVTNVSAPAFALETFDVAGSPFDPTTGGLNDDSAQMSISESNIGALGYTSGGVLKSTNEILVIKAYDDAQGPANGTALAGTTADVGGTWQALSGSGTQTMVSALGTFVGGTSDIQIDGTATGTRFAQLGTANYGGSMFMVTRLRPNPVANTSETGFYARYVDANNYISVGVNQTSGTQITVTIKQVLAGTTTAIQTFIATVGGAGMWIELGCFIDENGHIKLNVYNCGSSRNGSRTLLGTVVASTNTYFSQTGTGATGKIGIIDRVFTTSPSSRWMTGLWVYADHVQLNGLARSRDVFTNTYKTIGDGSHSIEHKLDFTGGPFWIDNAGRWNIYLRLIIKYLRSTTQYIAAEMNWTVTNPSGTQYELVGTLRIIKMVGTTRTVLATGGVVHNPYGVNTAITPYNAQAGVANVGPDTGVAKLSASIVGNVIAASWVAGGDSLSVGHTLVSGDATTFGTGVATGNYGFQIDQPTENASGGRITDIDNYQVIGAITTPQTASLTLGGNYRSRPKIRIGSVTTGPSFPAGAQIIATSADGVKRGSILIQKPIESPVLWIDYDTDTGVTKDQNGNTLFGYVSDVSEDIELPPQQQTTFELQAPNWTSGTSLFQVEARNNWR